MTKSVFYLYLVSLPLNEVLFNLNPSLLSNTWSSCYAATYATPMSASLISTILTTCSGSKLLLGCRPVGSTALTVAAAGNRADVLYNCGTTTACVNQVNGVGWYFSDSYSWGFA